MASLQISGSVRFEPLLGLNRIRHFSPIGSLGFPRFRRRFSIGRPLLLRRSSSSFSGGGESDGDDKGFITDAERDGSGSVLGFQLAPPDRNFRIFDIRISEIICIEREKLCDSTSAPRRFKLRLATVLSSSASPRRPATTPLPMSDLDPPAPQKEAATSPPPSPVKVHQTTYAAAVNHRPSLKKYDYEVKMVDGIPTIEIPEDVVKDSVPLWDDFLVGRFPEPAPHVAKIHVIVNKIWPLGNKSIKIDVFENNSKSVKFRIRDAATRSRILRRGMWNIAGKPMIVSKWSPIPEETMPEIKTMPLWVTVKNVPHSLFSWPGLSFLTSPVGHPIKLHPETELCSSFDVGKVFVEVNLSQELPKSFRFKLGEELDETVEFVYPWLPPRCTRCKRWGHLEDVCILPKKFLTEMQSVDIEEGEIVATKEATPNLAEASTVVLEESHVNVSNEESNPQMKIHPPVSEIPKNSEATPTLAEASTVVLEESNVNVSDEQTGWSYVSPGKGCKSREHSPLKFGEVSILAPSRFSVLQTPEDQENQEETSDSAKNETEQPPSLVSEKPETQKQRPATSEQQIPVRTMPPRSSKSSTKVNSTITYQRSRDQPQYQSTQSNSSNKRNSQKNH